MKRAYSRKNLWDAAPAFLKATVGKSLGMLPLSWLLGRRFRERFRFVQESQWWDEEQIRNYQFRELKDLLTLAYEHTEYYRKAFDQVGFHPGDFKDLSDLMGLPTIDKATVREHLHEMLTMPISSPSVDYMSTSGTGGNPLAFYIGRDRSATEFAHLSLSWARAGYRPGMTLAVFRGNIVSPDRSGLYHQYDPLLRQHVYSSFHLTEEQIGRYVEHLHQVRPHFLHAYPSSAFTLSRFMVANNLHFPTSVIGILLESEPVYEYQRDFIAQHFPVRIYSSYGHTEKLVLASECEYSPFYHVWPTYGYCELLDGEGNTVEEGQQGEIVGTGFINRVVPFIRYRTDDFAVHAGNKCTKCNRNHLLLDKLQAHRSQEFLVTKNYRAIVAWTALNMHDDTFDGVMQFQFVQTSAGEADLNVVPSKGPVQYDLRRIRSHLESKLRGQINVTVNVCDKIEPTKSGKKPIVIQKVPGIDKLLQGYEA